jgi:biotin carboxylase
VPGVLKPRRSTASAGLSIVQDEQAVERELAERRAWPHLVYEELIPAGRHPAGEPWLGDYVSVETCSTGTERFHVAIFDKAPAVVLDPERTADGPQVMEMADFAPTQLPREAQETVLRLTDEALDALGVRWRITHTELRFVDGRAEVIEVNGRLGGEVVRLLDILDGPDLVRAALSVALQAEPELDGELGSGYAASVKPLLPDRRAPVRSDVSRADVRRLPSIVGVDVVARRGAPPSASDFRAVDVSFAAGDVEGLKASLAGILDGVAALYRADGVGDDPWLNRMRTLAAA